MLSGHTKMWPLSIALYLLMYFAWSAWQSLLLPGIAIAGPVGIGLSIAVKAAIWLIPPLILLKDKDAWLIWPKEMFLTAFPWLGCLAMLCFSAAFLHTVRLAVGRQNTFVAWDHMFLALSISAGVIEELCFRGFLFNRQAALWGTVPAALLNGLQFMLFHYPGLILGRGFGELISARSLMLFAVGSWFSLSFAKWKNIWVLIIVHSVWNILSYYFALAG